MAKRSKLSALTDKIKRKNDQIEKLRMDLDKLEQQYQDELTKEITNIFSAYDEPDLTDEEKLTLMREQIEALSEKEKDSQTDREDKSKEDEGF